MIYFNFAVSFIIVLCVVVLFCAVLLNFIKSQQKEKVKQEKRSVVATGTMTLFFMFFYLLIRNKIGVVENMSAVGHVTYSVIGVLLIIIGCIFNILGRLTLGKNWGNQIRIYDNHTLVDSGVYRIVRHPLYASIIWMFFGASIVYLNYAAFLANVFIFIPFMYYRAKQEEMLLTAQFDKYNDYRKRTGMFFPNIFRRWKNAGV